MVYYLTTSNVIDFVIYINDNSHKVLSAFVKIKRVGVLNIYTISCHSGEGDWEHSQMYL